MAERTFVSATSGPVVLGLSLPVGHVHVHVGTQFGKARVYLETDDSTGPAADAVRGARTEQNGQAFGIEVPEMPGNVMTQSVRGHRVVQSMGTVYGSVTGVSIVNGRVISGSSQGMATVSPITANVFLPAGSSLAFVTTSGDAKVFGYVDALEFRSVSGDLHADGVQTLTARTTSGDVVVGRATGTVTAQSVSGDIDINLYDGRQAELHTTSGDIEVKATPAASGSLGAHSVSGNVRLFGTGHLRVGADSLSGRVRRN
ncbi:DUF4097 family beta strand repeat-containing protein [Streptomyces formicae]|uniref:DUF4097 domain-containing protein n=1 Tax=Streptomyces formicae TaxID=1616117 RepID=A0A291Q7X3_9ACTN|nr:DUF4097 family beta strand repeat-containing protein [Streptomyces formicae]ATL27583.1 hypothetical protein KY5_2565 [Streptomyces formicae]